MEKKDEKVMIELIPTEHISGRIFLIRNCKVMLDSDLAKLYGVETKALNQAVSRNIDRFPKDFMFKLAQYEYDFLRSQFVTLRRHGKHSKYLPRVFTEQGVAMLSSVLRSKQAIQVNIQIIRTFIHLREMLMGYKELEDRIEKMESKYSRQFSQVFDAIKQLLIQEDESQKEIGFKSRK